MNYSLHTAGHILFFIYWQFQPCTENETLVNAPLYSNKKAPPVKWRPAAPLLKDIPNRNSGVAFRASGRHPETGKHVA
ncbi:hypothetical protein HMPREF3038_00476 [Akkermansia sp. KLE1797]|nr:hypothetical protein HMPREF3038_00476 [Akkermansia sp. KLE1797]KXU55606.1 hypothetical protein HMPREF3039_00163 [Akkermansia sp. KLE1798]KZA05463.1 hypothetical protein HMPREF1326_00870 [Akkermansia sp. KLE1605]